MAAKNVTMIPAISSYKVRDNWYWHLPEDVAMLFSDDTRNKK